MAKVDVPIESPIKEEPEPTAIPDICIMSDTPSSHASQSPQSKYHFNEPSFDMNQYITRRAYKIRIFDEDVVAQPTIDEPVIEVVVEEKKAKQKRDTKLEHCKCESMYNH
jgi:hypothetical protein